MPRTLWSGSLSFGLVNVPVVMVTAVRDLDLHFRQLHESDGAPIEVQRWCSKEDVEVRYEDIERAFGRVQLGGRRVHRPHALRSDRLAQRAQRLGRRFRFDRKQLAAHFETRRARQSGRFQPGMMAILADRVSAKRTRDNDNFRHESHLFKHETVYETGSKDED